MRPVIGARISVNPRFNCAAGRAARAGTADAAAETAHAGLGELGKAVAACTVGIARGHGAVQIGARLPGRGFVDARIDAVQHVALVHQRTLGEQPRADDARHLRPDLGGLEGGGAARQQQLERHALLFEHHVAGLGRGLPGTLLLFIAAAAGGQRQ